MRLRRRRPSVGADISTDASPGACTGRLAAVSGRRRRAAPSLAGAAGHLRISPRASRLAADSGIDPRTITGTGPEGRITERDVKAAVDAASAQPRSVRQRLP